jgi:hypothetical protein
MAYWRFCLNEIYLILGRNPKKKCARVHPAQFPATWGGFFNLTIICINSYIVIMPNCIRGTAFVFFDAPPAASAAPSRHRKTFYKK